MNNYIVLNKRENIKHINQIIQELNLTNTLKNKRTIMWENEDLQINIDRNIIRVMIYCNEDVERYKNFIIQR